MIASVLAVAAVLTLAGCTSAQDLSPSLTPRPSATVQAAPARVVLPARTTSEIARDVYTGDTYDGTSGVVPKGTEALTLRISCAGAAGTRMRYDIRDADNSSISSGDAACDGAELRDDDASGNFSKAVSVHLDADPGVTNGWAILEPSPT